MMKVGILTVSDSCFSGTATDTSGTNLKNLIESGSWLTATVEVYEIVPDEIHHIKEKLLEWSCSRKLDVILTTGGTGCSPRDVTPEATKSILDKEIPGLSMAMFNKSAQITPMAMLSRSVCGICRQTLIINLPGSKKGSQECLEVVLPVIKHAVDLVRDNKRDISSTHAEVQQSTTSPQLHGFHRGGHHHHRGHHHHGHHHHGHQQNSQPVSSNVDDTFVARRPRKSTYPLITVQQAVDTVLSQTFLMETEEVALKDALHRCLAELVRAPEPLPPFRASIKDGYAVIASDGIGVRKVVGDTTAGSMGNVAVTSGTCIRISTGAAVPDGADAVIQVEDTELVKVSEDGKHELEVKFLTEATPGQDIRPVGCDIELGQCILSSGQLLGPSEIGILASVGVVKVKCYRLPRVGVMSTGNELLEPEAAAEQGKIRDSNRVMLMALLKELRHNPVDLGIASDTPASLLAQITAALNKCDVIVTSGGVSMGEKDLIKDVLISDFKATVHFGRVLMKPGKPTAFATIDHEGRKKLFFGLPGNPVSSMVTCNLYVIPALRKMAGDESPVKSPIKAMLADGVTLDPRPEYHRCTLDWSVQPADLGFPQRAGIPLARSTGNQLSSRLLSMCTANALLVLPESSENKRQLNPGDIVDAIVIGNLV